MIDEPQMNGDGTIECQECGTSYERIGYHWSVGSCPYPELSTEKRSLVFGLMLGDGTLRTDTKHPFVQAYMVNKPFLEWLDSRLEWLATGVSLHRTASHGARLKRSNGSTDASEDDYHDVYTMQTRSMPQFGQYRAWYAETESKQIVADERLTAEAARVWYVSDGTLTWDRRYPESRPYVSIGVASRSTGTAVIRQLFLQSPFTVTPRIDERSVRFTVAESEQFLDWIGPAPDGFAYKWETESLDEYDRKKPEVLD
jgi:hypothetical protein